jgi:hypothetical protein
VTAKSDSYTIGQYNIALQEVKPTHAVGTPLDPKAYTATFVVTHS